MTQQGRHQPQSQRSLWLPLKYKKQDKRPLWETRTLAAPRAGGAQARRGINPSTAFEELEWLELLPAGA